MNKFNVGDTILNHREGIIGTIIEILPISGPFGQAYRVDTGDSGVYTWYEQAFMLYNRIQG